MPRSNLTAEQNAVLSEVVTSPSFLFEVALSQRTYRLSSFADSVNLLSQQWLDASIVVSGPTQKAGGMLVAQVSIPFDAEQAGGRLIDDVLAQRPQDRPAKIYQTYYRDNAYVYPVLLLDGLVDDVVLTSGAGDQKPRITLSIASSANRGGLTPFVRLSPPLLNWMTPAGSVLIWGNGRYEIDRR